MPLRTAEQRSNFQEAKWRLLRRRFAAPRNDKLRWEIMGEHFWYALHTKPHKERQVAAYFSERGIEVFYPTIPIRKRRGRSDRKSYFPRYLFARTDLDAVGLWGLQYAPGMERVVMIGDKPAHVDQRIITAVREKIAQIEVVDAHGDALEHGDRIVITSGPFKDFDAMFDQKLSAQGRVRVLIELVERYATLDIDADSIEKSRRPPAPKKKPVRL